MKLSLSALAVLLLASVPAAAQYGADQDYTLSFGGGVGGTLALAPDAFTDGVNNNTSLSGFFTGPLHQALSWRAEFGYDEFECDSETCGADVLDTTISFTRMAGGVQYATTGRAQGYGFLMVGAYRQALGASSAHLPFSTDEWRFAMAFGGGLNYFLGEKWGIGGEWDFHMVPQSEDRNTIWYSTPTGHVFWRF
jgi:hypothetical protein